MTPGVAVHRAFAWMTIGAPRGSPRFRRAARMLRIIAWTNAVVFALTLLIVGLVASLRHGPTAMELWGQVLYRGMHFGLLVLANVAFLRLIDASRRALAWMGLVAAAALAWCALLSLENAILVFHTAFGDDALANLVAAIVVIRMVPVALTAVAGGVLAWEVLRPELQAEVQARARWVPIFDAGAVDAWHCGVCRIAFHVEPGTSLARCPTCMALVRRAQRVRPAGAA